MESKLSGLQEKLIQTDLAQYTQATWNGQNESGCEPIGDNVLVLVDQVAPQSRGGIAIPDDVVHRMNMATESGVIVACGAGAFMWSQDRRRPFEGTRPVPGTRVHMERYGGRLLHGDDGRAYRLVTDKQIGGVRT